MICDFTAFEITNIIIQFDECLKLMNVRNHNGGIFTVPYSHVRSSKPFSAYNVNSE